MPGMRVPAFAGVVHSETRQQDYEGEALPMVRQANYDNREGEWKVKFHIWNYPRDSRESCFRSLKATV